MRKLFEFSKEEFFVLAGIAIVLVSLIVYNYGVALRKSRDSQRKQDIRDITNMISNFQTQYGLMPREDTGKMVACKPRKTVDGSLIFSTCNWGDVIEGVGPLPQDPNSKSGRSYLYLSDGKDYQIFASLESSSEAEYDSGIVKRNLTCDNQICNFGLNSGTIPIYKSFKEYYDEIDAKTHPRKK